MPRTKPVLPALSPSKGVQSKDRLLPTCPAPKQQTGVTWCGVIPSPPSFFCHPERSEESHPSIANRKSKTKNHKPLTPAQISKLKILDPACGSGLFLLRAYTHLLNHHRDWYVGNNPTKHPNKIYAKEKAGGGQPQSQLGDGSLPLCFIGN